MTIIKFLSILFFFNILFISNQYAFQMAIVKNVNTKVYADQECTTPIGLIAKGKLIKIGEVARSKGNVYPIVVSGKIAYVKIDDIFISSDLQKIDGPHYAQNDEYLETLKEYNQAAKNIVSLHIGAFTPGTHYERFLKTYNVPYQTKFGYLYELTFESPLTNRFMLTGGGYIMQLSNPYISKNNFGIKFGPQWRLFYLDDFLIHINLSLLLAKNYENYEDETLYGIKPSVMIAYYVSKNLGIRGGGGIIYQATSNKYKKDASEADSPYILGGQLFLGLIWSI